MSKESKAGKVTCRILKEIRQQIANANDIKFVTSKCRYQGDCLGTCPKCEAEIHYLEQQLLSRRMAGLNVKVIGVSLGLSALFSSPLYGQETVKDSLKDTSNILPQVEVIGYKSVTKVTTVCGGLSIVEAEEKHVVKGIVVDKCGNPLIGAVVTERGMNNSTTTDREGYFLLRVRKGRSVLEVSSEVLEFRVMGPSISNIMQMSEVTQRMDECWNNSISSEKSHSRREFGFTLQMHTYSNAAPEYSFIDGSAMSSNDCSTGGINTITFTIGTNEYNESASYSVALFHTHPPLTNCPSTSSRITGPSSVDDDTANTNKIPSVIFDYGDRNEQIYGGHSSNLPYVISYAGSYDQRL